MPSASGLHNLSMGQKLFAVPFSAFKYNVTTHEYALDVSKGGLEGGTWIRPGSLASDARGTVEPRCIHLLRNLAILGLACRFRISQTWLARDDMRQPQRASRVLA